MKRILAVGLSAALVLGPLPQAAADDTDIFGANVLPNILVFIDSSGSMDDYIDQAEEAPYNPALTYTASGGGLPKASGSVYRCRAGYTIDQCENDASLYVVYKTSVSLVPNADPPASPSAARDSLSTAGKWNGRIAGTSLQLRTGNYLNYHFSPTGGHENKITVAKRVLTNLINNTDNVRFGLAKFTGNSTQGPGGATIIADLGSSKATLISAINGITPGGYTPLKGALYDMGSYYKRTTSAPIQYECQPNYIVMMSDGLQNGYGDVRTEATLRYTQDHRSDLPGLQNVVVDTVGFAIPPTEADAANDVLQTAARNGGGQFYSTTSERDLENALEDAIRRITTATYAFATPVIPTTSATGAARTYMAAFQTDPSRPFWHGYLNAYTRDSTGQVPVDANGVPLASALAWEAGQLLSQKSASSRTIYTVAGGSQVEFSTGTTALTTTLLAVSSSADRDNLINFIRGQDSYDEDQDSNLTEDRSWKLGDIFHSTPVLIGPPMDASTDSSYLDFKAANASRTTVLVAGANDGMLHAFRESDGEELWAFVPPDQLDRLKLLTIQSADHPFYVDAGPIAADVKIGGVWKTIVVFGERRGGRSYHALDVTTPTAPQYLWSFTESKLGETWSEPVIGKVKIDGTDRFVAFFGGGYDTAQNNQTGKAVFAIDAATGQMLWEYYNSSSSDDRSYMNFSLAANPTAVDLNQDDYLDAIYIGDVGGQLWKFDVSAAATLSGGLVSNWTGKRLFAAAPTQDNPPGDGEYYPAQAIYSAPAVAMDDKAHLWLYFGTGDRNHPNRAGTNRFYGIKDNGSMSNGTPLTESSLVDVTSSNITNVDAIQGWYFRLASTEKVLAAADVFNKIVFFSSFTPGTGNVCTGGGGVARLYALQMKTGYAAVDFSQPSLPLLETSNSTLARSKAVGTGIPSRPIIVMTESGATLTTSVISATTSQQLPSNPAPPPETVRRILYWKELL
jgi:type IV pilus assembly protein PilY1